jgi:anti-sigma-K factor RskA
MTKSDLLTNGLLEQYVLGELDANQCDAIDQLVMSESEVKEKLRHLEHNFENLALENAINPPAFVKEKLFSGIKTPQKTISIAPKDNTKFYLGIAASFAALFLIGSIWLYSELNSIKQEISVIQEENNSLKNNLETTTLALQETDQWLGTIRNPNTEQYILKGNALSPEAKIISYINHDEKSVIINAKKLPELDADHDYQMWADVDGVMIDMGIIPKNKELIAMTYIEDAASLNITIEPLGGNDHPTVERLISNIYLN